MVNLQKLKQKNDGTVKPGYSKLGYKEFPVITNNFYSDSVFVNDVCLSNKLVIIGVYCKQNIAGSS